MRPFSARGRLLFSNIAVVAPRVVARPALNEVVAQPAHNAVAAQPIIPVITLSDDPENLPPEVRARLFPETAEEPSVITID